MSTESKVISGIVRNGVVVPQANCELPDGAHVNIVLQSAEMPQELKAELEAWQRAGDQAWQLIEMLDVVHLERQLGELGVVLTPKVTDASRLRDILARVRKARDLETKGVKVDWRQHSYDEMVDLEARKARVSAPRRRRLHATGPRSAGRHTTTWPPCWPAIRCRSTRRWPSAPHTTYRPRSRSGRHRPRPTSHPIRWAANTD